MLSGLIIPGSGEAELEEPNSNCDDPEFIKAMNSKPSADDSDYIESILKKSRALEQCRKIPDQLLGSTIKEIKKLSEEKSTELECTNYAQPLAKIYCYHFKGWRVDNKLNVTRANSGFDWSTIDEKTDCAEMKTEKQQEICRRLQGDGKFWTYEKCDDYKHKCIQHGLDKIISNKDPDIATQFKTLCELKDMCTGFAEDWSGEYDGYKESNSTNDERKQLFCQFTSY